MTNEALRVRLDALRDRPLEEQTVDRELAKLASDLERITSAQVVAEADAGASKNAHLIYDALSLANDDETKSNLPPGAEAFATRIIGRGLGADIDKWIAEQKADVNAVTAECEHVVGQLGRAELHREVLRTYRELLDLLK